MTEPADVHLIARRSGTTVGYLRLVTRTICAAGDSDWKSTILGVSTVIVKQNIRGEGIGKKIMHAANHHISRQRISALLTCNKDKEAFYAACGWKCCHVTFLDQQGDPFFRSPVVMAFPIATFPSNTIMIEGDTF